MAIYNLKYLNEVYKSKFADYLNDDDDEYEEKDSESSSKEIDHLNKQEIARINLIVKMVLDNFNKLKKCCDYVDLSYKENINDDGERESPYDKYYREDGKEFLELLDGDVLSGYPDLRNAGSQEYEKDCKEFVKKVNEEFTKRNIKAKFMQGPNGKDDEVISFGIKSLKEK